MALLDVSIVNVALPSIRTGLGAGESDLQWVLSGYALAFGLVLVPAAGSATPAAAATRSCSGAGCGKPHLRRHTSEHRWSAAH